MRHVAITVIAALCASDAAAQSSPYRSLRVRSCAYADSLLGPIRDDSRGEVQGFYHQERDSTYLVTGGAGKRPRVDLSIKLAGQRPARDPAAQLIVMLRGAEAQIMSASKEPLTVTLVLNDSVTIAPASVAAGTFIAPKNAPIVLPVSALLLADDLVSVAQARTIVINVGVVPVRLTPDERRQLRAILRAAVCPP